MKKLTAYKPLIFWPVFILSALFYFYLSALPLKLVEQAILAWGLFFILLALSHLGFMKTPVGRVLFLLLVSFVSLRYLLWRALNTLIYTGPVDFFFMSLLFVAEVQVTAVYLMSMFTNVWPLKRPHVPLPEDQATWPTVDVFLPTYTEDEELVQITATAATQLDYPKDKLNIYILDDGSTQQRKNHPVLGPGAYHREKNLRKLADSLGIHYLSRKSNQAAKAGNINHALEHSQGDIILMLDCDHVPCEDFLQQTLGYFFKDSKLFLVQTPHFFINPDPIEKSLDSFHQAPSENEMFYRGIHPSIDFWDASFFCGSAALLKREFLVEAGGIRGDTITEDCETSLDLHARGYHSVFIDKPMVCGLSPETFEDFVVQRTRWCQGMLQLGFLNNPSIKRGLTFAQRICYSTFYMYWFFGFARFIFFLAPTLYLLFGLQVYHASLLQASVYAIPHLFVSLLSMKFMYGEFRWPLYSELYESVQSIFLLPAALGVIENPKAPTFKVTPKGKHLDHDFLSPLAGPFYLMFFVMIISVPIGVMSWFDYPYGHDGIIICLVWLVINLLITFTSLGIFWEKHQIRHFPRAWAQGPVQLKSHNDKLILTGELSDLSLTGVGLHCPLDIKLQMNQRVIVEIKNSNDRTYSLEARVKYIKLKHKEQYCGLEFEELESNYSIRVNLVYGDSQRWQDFWHRDKKTPGIGKVSWLFLCMGSKGVYHSLSGIKVMILYYWDLLVHRGKPSHEYPE